MLSKITDVVIYIILGVIACIVVAVYITELRNTVITPPAVRVPLDDTKFTVEHFNTLPATLITDNATGCEYFMSTQGVTTPRTYPDGTQFCGQSANSNVEINYE